MNLAAKAIAMKIAKSAALNTLGKQVLTVAAGKIVQLVIEQKLKEITIRFNGRDEGPAGAGARIK